MDTLAPDAHLPRAQVPGSAGVEELHVCMPVDDLAETKAWLKARKSEGYEFMKCVLANMEGHVIWPRGNPREWNWKSGN